MSDTLTSEVVARALKKAKESRMPAVKCEDCGAALYLLFSGNAGGVSLLNICPCCGGTPVPEAQVSRLSARCGGCVFVEAGSMSEAPWWIVVSSKRGPAEIPARHAAEHLAEMEARRLALKHPEDSFTVYRAVLVAEAPRVVVRRLEDDDAPPF